MKIGKLRLQKPRTIWNIDGMHNKDGTIKDFVDLQVRVGPKIQEMKFLVTNLGEDEIVLGYPWLAAFQPRINWKEATIAEDMQPIVIKTLGLKMDKEVARIAKAWTELRGVHRRTRRRNIHRKNRGRGTQKSLYINTTGSKSPANRGEDLGPDSPSTIPQVEKSFLRNRIKPSPETPTMGS
jgi:hypothetical protein